MEFLPILIDGNKVYAGFWKRFCAALVDMAVWFPFGLLIYKFESINIPTAMVAAVIGAFFFSSYSIYLNLKYGGTLGKLAVGIRVTKPNGEKIQFKEAFLRSLVDILYAVIFSVLQVYAISRVDPAAYLSAGYVERMALVVPLYPEFSKYTTPVGDLWYWSEMIVLLLNKRKRALHDFIAGTVVINKEYS